MEMLTTGSFPLLFILLAVLYRSQINMAETEEGSGGVFYTIADIPVTD